MLLHFDISQYLSIMVLGNALTDLETKYNHLLQPIRDLAKNWDVDIASHLEEYLDEVNNDIIGS